MPQTSFLFHIYSFYATIATKIASSTNVRPLFNELDRHLRPFQLKFADGILQVTPFLTKSDVLGEKPDSVNYI